MKNPEDVIKGLLLVLKLSPTMWSPELDRETLSGVVRSYNKWAKKYRNPAMDGMAEDIWLEVITTDQRIHIKKLILKELKKFTPFHLDNDTAKIIVTHLDGSKTEFDGNWLIEAAEEVEDE